MWIFEQISCHHFVVVDGYAYFSNRSYNGLFRVELKTGKTTFLGSFKGEMVDEYNIHWEILLREDVIYFFPRRGRHVHIYYLDKQIISTVEIRKISEKFFRIGEIVINGALITFLPIEEDAPIRRLDLKTFSVTEMTRQDAFSGTYLARSRKAFLKPKLLERYQIPMSNLYSWEQMDDGSWCAFLLTEHHLLWCNPEIKRIERMPLIVVNKAELNAYLQPMRRKYISRGQLLETESLLFPEYLKTIVECEHIGKGQSIIPFSVGQKIWCSIRIP